MATPSGKVEIVATQILVETKQAIANLKNFDKSVQNSATRVSDMANQIKRLSAELGQTTRQIANTLKEANAPSGKGRFGNLGLQNEQIEKARKLADASISFEKAQDRAAKASSNLGGAMEQAGNKGKTAWEKVTSSVNVLNIAFGILASEVIRSAIDTIRDFFADAIKSATELEETMFRLSNVERELSFKGIEISIAGLRKGIAEIRSELKVFSKEDVASLVGKISISTKDLKLTEQQILDLSKAVGILNIRSTENEDLNQTASKVITSLLTDQSKGVSTLGIQLGDTAIKLKAMELGFLRAGESVDDLTKREKELAKIQIVIDSANGELETLDEYLSTNAAKIKENQAAWEDLKTTVGQIVIPFIPGLTKDIDNLTAGVNGFKVIIIEALSRLGAYFATLKLFLTGGIKSVGEFREKMKEALQIMREDFVNTFFKEVPSNAPEWFKKIYGGLIKAPKETTTGAPKVDGEQQEEDQKKAEEHGEKLADIMRDNAQKLEDIETDYQRKREDIARDYSEKLADLARDTAEKREDAERDYLLKVEDINRDANQKVQDAQEDYRKKQIDAEEEYQRKLRELREKFLFDLEDALRERDARQVLRLIRQYQMDKKSLEERRKLQQEEDKQDLQRKLEDIERERQLKLQEAKRDYDLKLQEIARGEARERQEINRWKQRQLADARLWYQRQLEDQRLFLQRKLADLAQAYAKELQMAQQFNSALSGYGTSTSTGGGFPVFSTTGSGGIGSGQYNPYDVRTIYRQLGIPGFADGGTVIAKKPTLAMFGEAGAEAATFTPLNKNGRDVNKVFGSASGFGGAGSGYLNLRIAISDGLIADIVDSSLDKVATQIEHVRRTV